MRLAELFTDCFRMANLFLKQIELHTMTNQILAYARVSSESQNLQRQLDAFAPHNPDRIFTDKISGATFTRSGLDDLMNHAREGDTVLVHSLDRLGRSLREVLDLVEKFYQRGITVKFLKERVEYNPGDPFGKLLIQQLLAFAEFEREIIRVRQREGIKAAHKRGAKFGRPKALTAKQIREAREQITAGKSVSDCAIDLGVGRTTLWRALQA